MRRSRRNPVLVHLWRLSSAAGVCVGIVGSATGAYATPPAQGQPCEAPWPIAISNIDRTTPDGKPMRGLLATVRLQDPRLEVLVTDPLAKPIADQPTADSVLETVDAWARRVNADLAINANFFGRADGKKGFVAGVASDVIGLSVSDGKVVSPARVFRGVGDPVLVFTRDRKARIKREDEQIDADVFDAVAGIGASESDPSRSGFLVTAGTNTADSARVEPDKRHPRSAVGVSADGWTLYVLAIDGRQPDWSVGATLRELADVLILAGAHDAINLDGGGSTTMLHRGPGESVHQMNRPSEKSGLRPVANCLGFKVHMATKGGAPATPKRAGEPAAEVKK